MYLDEKSYGLRRRSTGDLVRMETEVYYDEDSVHYERTLVLAKDEPVFQSTDLKDVMRGRFSKEFFGTSGLGFDGVSSRLGELDDYEIVEFDASFDVDGADPDVLAISIRPLEFRLVDGVRLQRFNEAESDKLMKAAFAAEDLARYSECVVKAVVIKGEGAAGMQGALVLPPASRLNLREGPMGVLLVRTVGDTTFGLMTPDIHLPEFHDVVIPEPSNDVEADTPWGDCKVAYGWDATDEGEELLTRIWDEAVSDPSKSIWPEGWSINETDCSGARCVIVFRIENVLPTREDGARVQELVSMIEQGVDPRETAAPAYGR